MLILHCFFYIFKCKLRFTVYVKIYMYASILYGIILYEYIHVGPLNGNYKKRL